MYAEQLENLGIDLKGKKNGTAKVLCPKCSHTRKKHKDPCLFVNISNGIYRCYNDTCDFKGTVAPGETIINPSYKKPEESSINLSEQAIEYLKGRGISEPTIERFNIKEGMAWMPQWGEKRNTLQFNYYRDGELINIKYRDGAKKMKLAKDAELILYGLENIRDSKDAVITEGEIDALSFYEAGIWHVTSVPNGSPGINPKTGEPNKMNLAYLDNCYNELKNKERIYLAIDNDVAGHALEKELARRLGKERIWLIQYPDDCNDPNEVLVSHGPEKLKECYKNAQPYPIDYIKKAEDIMPDVWHIYDNGYPEGEKLQNFDKLNERITWLKGESILITGQPAHGKSNFADNIIADLANEDNWKFGVLSAEKGPAIHAIELAQKICGKNFRSMESHEAESVMEFVHTHFFFVDTDAMRLTMDNIINKANEMVVRYGINSFILDNWSFVELQIPGGDSENNYVGTCLSRINSFAKTRDCAFFIVAHPKKINERVTNRYQIGDGYIVSGSAHFFNLIDNGLTIHRDFDKNTTTVRIWKVRWWYVGSPGFIDFKYNTDTWRYEEIESPEEAENAFLNNDDDPF